MFCSKIVKESEINHEGLSMKDLFQTEDESTVAEAHEWQSLQSVQHREQKDKPNLIGDMRDKRLYTEIKNCEKIKNLNFILKKRKEFKASHFVAFMDKLDDIVKYKRMEIKDEVMKEENKEENKLNKERLGNLSDIRSNLLKNLISQMSYTAKTLNFVEITIIISNITRVYNNIPKYEKDPLVHFTHTILKLFIENQKEIIHSNKITENRLSFNLITFDKKLERLISYTCYNCYFNNELLSQYEDAFRDVLNKNFTLPKIDKVSKLLSQLNTTQTTSTGIKISMKFPNTEAPPNVFDSMDHTSKISILNLFYKYGMKRTSLVVYLLESIMGDRDMFDLGIVKEFESYTDSLEFQNIAKPSKFAVFSQIDTKHLFILYKVIDNILDSAKQSSNNLENYMTEIEKEFIRRNKMIVFMKYNKIKINEFKNSLVSYPNDLLVFLKTSHKYLRAIHEEDLHKDLLKVHLLYAHKLPNIIFTMSLKECLESIEYLVKIKDLIVAMNCNASEIKTIVKKFEDEFYTNVQKKICKDNDIDDLLKLLNLIIDPNEHQRISHVFDISKLEELK